MTEVLYIYAEVDIHLTKGLLFIRGGCLLFRGFVSMIHGWVFRAEVGVHHIGMQMFRAEAIVHYLGVGVQRSIDVTTVLSVAWSI